MTSDGTATANAIAKFTTACNIQNSAITEVNGNVGVGTVPASLLHLSAASPELRITSTDPTAVPQLSFYDGGNLGGFFQYRNSGASSPKLFQLGGFAAGSQFAIMTAGVERVRVDAAGNGTSNPLRGLHIRGGSGAMLLDAGPITSDPAMFFSHDNFASPFRNYITANRFDERLDIIATNVYTATFKAGNVGVGTTTPAAKLDVAGAGNFTGSTTDQILNVTQNGAGVAGVFHSNGGGKLLSGVTCIPFIGCPEVFKVDAGGQITGGQLDLVTNSTHVLEGDAGCSTGFAGIGFGAAGLTSCTGYSLLGNGSDTMLGRPSGGGMFFREANADQMAIAAGGNVGIGTTMPVVKLDVRGDVKLGTNGGLFACGAADNLRIITGQVNLDGTIGAGSHFTVTKNLGTGSYTVTFSAAFTGKPVVVATSFQTPGFPEVDILGTGVMLVLAFDSSGHSVDGAFMFIVMGPR